MSETCPKCGGEISPITQRHLDVDLREWTDESWCLTRQLAAAQAENERLRIKLQEALG